METEGQKMDYAEQSPTGIGVLLPSFRLIFPFRAYGVYKDDFVGCGREIEGWLRTFIRFLEGYVGHGVNFRHRIYVEKGYPGYVRLYNQRLYLEVIVYNVEPRDDLKAHLDFEIKLPMVESINGEDMIVCGGPEFDSVRVFDAANYVQL